MFYMFNFVNNGDGIGLGLKPDQLKIHYENDWN
jgi:hypothetical protein